MSKVADLYNDAEKLKDDGQLPEAIAKLVELLELDDKHVLSHLALAVLYGRTDEHDKAIRHGERACELEATEPFNFTALSVTYQRAWAGTQNQEYIARAEGAMAQAQMLQGRG